jgi:hypothetical protein
MCLNFMEAPDMWKAACRHRADTGMLLAVSASSARKESSDNPFNGNNTARHH